MKNQNIKNSYAYKILLVVIVVISTLMCVAGAALTALCFNEGIYMDSARYRTEKMEEVSDYYEMMALENYVEGTDWDFSDTNFRYMIYLDDDKNPGKAQLSELSGMKSVAGNVSSIADVEQARISYYTAGVESRFVHYYTTPFGLPIGSELGWSVEAYLSNEEARTEYPVEGFGYSLKGNDYRYYLKYDDVYYPVRNEERPLIRLFAFEPQTSFEPQTWMEDDLYVYLDEEGISVFSEFYRLGSVDIFTAKQWFSQAYGIDKKQIYVDYVFENEDGSYIYVPEEKMENVEMPGESWKVSADITAYPIDKDVFAIYRTDETLQDYIMVSWYDSSFAADDLYRQVSNGIQKLERYQYAALAVLLGGILLWVTAQILLFAAAGHHRTHHPKSKEGYWIEAEDGRGVIELRGLDLVPMDIYAAAVLFVVPAFFWWGGYVDDVVQLIGASLCVLFMMLFLISFAVNIKVGGWIRRLFCYRVCSYLWRLVQGIHNLFVRGRLHLKEQWQQSKGVEGLKKRAWICYTVILLLQLFAMVLFLSDSYLDGAVVLVIVILFVAMWVLIARWLLRALAAVARLGEGSARLAEGDLSYQIDLSEMPTDFAQLGEHINRIGAGLDRAVYERMKSDRMQTELITNVSHDIRTPLTSIINYVDLLSKEDLGGNEQAREYLDILIRQSERLKRLVSDLIDASKASSGSLKLNQEPINTSVLLTQAAGEYMEKLSDKGIALLIGETEEPMMIQADSRQLWRVFDNLLGNIAKYAQSGTRAYVDIACAAGLNDVREQVTITFRNISSARLNISSEELMERFVRGDASRNTEGSGLGLAIARSLTELMGGKMDLTIDGDLFKVTLGFPRL